MEGGGGGGESDNFNMSNHQSSWQLAPIPHPSASPNTIPFFYLAVIRPEPHGAPLTIAAHGLLQAAHGAHTLPNIVAVDFVPEAGVRLPILLGGVMAQATPEYFPTAGRHDAALAGVVVTAVRGLRSKQAGGGRWVGAGGWGKE
jgi:hypothetical protein